jgi:hypothetical protein
MYTRGMAQKTLIAQVGAYKKRTDGDIWRWLTALDWLMKNDRLPDKSTHDVINLKYGRDFLREHETYDIVVLHDIYDAGNLDIVQKIQANLPKLVWQAIETSSVASEKRWRWRLQQTKAKFIFVFETSPCCINGWGLGELEGYKVEHIDHQVAIYRRIDL